MIEKSLSQLRHGLLRRAGKLSVKNDATVTGLSIKGVTSLKLISRVGQKSSLNVKASSSMILSKKQFRRATSTSNTHLLFSTWTWLIQSSTFQTTLTLSFAPTSIC